MKKVCLSLLLLSVICWSSCSVVGGIFKAGAYTGIIAVVVVVIIIVLIISMFRKKS